MGSSVLNSDNVSAIGPSTERSAPGSRLSKSSIAILLFLVLVAAAAIAWPKSNYDGVFYTALTLRTNDALALHAAGMQFADRDPETVDSPYRDDLRKSPAHFQQQLPFYTVKPLYVVLLTLARNAGLGGRSGAFLSAISYCLLGGTAFFWLRRTYPDSTAALFTVILLLNPTALELIRWTSPDMMAICAAMIATCLIVEFERPFLGVAVLVLGIWIRPETILYAGLLLFVLFLTKRLPITAACGFAAAALASYFFITRNSYSFSVLFYHSVVEELTAPAQAHIALTRPVYFAALKHTLQYLSFANPLLCFPPLACAIQYFALGRRNLATAVSFAALIAAGLLFLAYPNFEARYFLSTLFY
ncbi:MAG: hypothetical protein WBY75_17800, partial [Terracidiphilus sp.]